MSLYVSQGIATQAFGVTFRSKLEAMWAYEFSSTKTEWEYADSPWHDFLLNGECHLEVKPLGVDFLMSALERAWPHRSEWCDDSMCFVLGEPSVAVWCFSQIVNCRECAALSFFTKDKSIKPELTEQKFLWNPKCGVYGHYCNHGAFFDYGIKTFTCQE